MQPKCALFTGSEQQWAVWTGNGTWLLFGICLLCFSSLVCAVQLLLSCWLRGLLCPCEQNIDARYFHLSRAVYSHVSMLMLKVFDETFSVSLYRFWSGQLRTAFLVAVPHRTISYGANGLACELHARSREAETCTRMV